MSCWGRRVAAAVVSLAVVAAGSPVRADEPQPSEEGTGVAQVEEPVSPFEAYAARTIDVFPIRVLGACATVVGFGAFILSVPLVGPFGRLEAIRNSWQYFVIGPVDYTFVRPLGEL